MRTRVTAILVAKQGGEWLEQTLEGVAAQTRRPDRLIAVVNGGKTSVAQQLQTHLHEHLADLLGNTPIVGTQNVLPFGAAIEQAVLSLPSEAVAPGQLGQASQPGQPGAADSADGVQDWFWLLTEDSAPEPRALAEVLATVQRAPSVVVAGPKLVNWDHPDRIIELGQSLTQRGDRWLLRRQERDQQQYDHLQDVLGVGPVGMLVRADVWRELSGFDPAYPVYDDALDFSVRARLAGHRVVVAPTSRVRFAQLGVAGPRIDRSRHVLRVAHRQARTADLHRRIAYAPALLAFFMWLGLPVIAVARVAWALIREQPGNMWAEFASALTVFFKAGALSASRRRVKSANVNGWGAVDPLRIDNKSVRTARMIDREVILASQGRLRDDLNFVSTGGLAVLATAVLAAIGLTWWAVTQTSLTGGGLAPLSDFGDLWANTRTVDGVPPDPFAWVLAVLGTFTFYNPSHAVVLMLVAAIPLAALGGWIWAAGLTTTVAGRALLALAWAFSPVMLGSLAAGRLPTLILAVALPWLLLAATRARESWSWTGLASLLAAVVLACAPVLIPAGIVLLVVGVVASPRGTARVLSIAIAPLALFAPNLFALLRGADVFGLMRDPGITPAFTPGSPWHLLIGFPEFGLEGWGSIFATLGLSALPATALVGVMLLPIVLLAAFGLITGKVHFTVLHAVLGAVGLLTAVGSSKLHLTSVGSESVAVWTASGLALYWIAVLGLAAVGTTALRKAAAPIVAVGLVTALVAVGPLAIKLAMGNTGIAPGATQMPAIVQAAGTQNPELNTLLVEAQAEGVIAAQIITGPGVRLDGIRNMSIDSGLTAQDQWIAELVGVLASTGDEAEVAAALAEHSVGFVLLNTEGATSQRSQLQGAFDQQTALENAGQTGHGLLWRVIDPESAAGADGAADGGEGVDGGAAADADASAAADAAEAAEERVDSIGEWVAKVSDFGTSVFAKTLWWVQVVVLIGMVLLALPTGEVVERPERRRRRKPATVAAGAAGAAGAAAQDGALPAEVDQAIADQAIADQTTADSEGVNTDAATLDAAGPVEPGPVEPGPNNATSDDGTFSEASVAGIEDEAAEADHESSTARDIEEHPGEEGSDR